MPGVAPRRGTGDELLQGADSSGENEAPEAASDDRSDPCGEDRLARLMEGYQRADREAVTQLVDCLSGRLMRFFERQTRDWASAEDLLQEFWMRVHRSRHAYRPGSRVLPWAYAIARRASIDRYRRLSRAHRVECDFEEGMNEAAQVRVGLAPEARMDLWRGLNALTEKERETLHLLKVEGLSLEDVSRVTGASVTAVKQRVHRAYLKLRNTLRGGS